MTEDQIKNLRKDTDGLLTYEFLANHIGESTPSDIDELIDILITVVLTGPFLASAALYLHAIDAEGYAPAIRRLVAAAIDKDREHNYLPDLITGLYGADYASRTEQLCASDDNFRRLYKRLCPTSPL